MLRLSPGKGRRPSAGIGAEAAGVEVVDGLLELGPGVHHERAVLGDGLADGLTAEE